jgi:hypothetical protein
MYKFRSITLSLVILLLIGVGISLAPLLKDPSFKIMNQSQHIVQVSAHWRGESRELGAIQPSSTYLLTLDDEAAMKFTAHYPDGRNVDSEEIYFTGGTIIIATITENEIKVKHDFDK